MKVGMRKNKRMITEIYVTITRKMTLEMKIQQRLKKSMKAEMAMRMERKNIMKMLMILENLMIQTTDHQFVSLRIKNI